MAPKCKTSDTGNSDMPKRNHKVLPLTEIYVCIGKNIVYIGFSTVWFQAPTGGLGTYLPQITGDGLLYLYLKLPLALK